MDYIPQVWKDEPNPSSPQADSLPLSPDNLNYMEKGIADSLQKSGGIMTGAIYKMEEKSENEYITKQDLLNFIDYLNQSPLTVARYDSGKAIGGREIFLGSGTIYTSSTKDDDFSISVNNFATINFVRPSGNYINSEGTLVFSIRTDDDGKRFKRIKITAKDESGNIVNSCEVSGLPVANGSYRKYLDMQMMGIPEGKLTFDIEADVGFWCSAGYLTVSFDCIDYDYTQRNILEYQ